MMKTIFRDVHLPVNDDRAQHRIIAAAGARIFPPIDVMANDDPIIYCINLWIPFSSLEALLGKTDQLLLTWCATCVRPPMGTPSEKIPACRLLL